MLINITLITVTLCFYAMVCIVYFTKKKINTKETKIYNWLILLGLLNLLCEISLCIYIVLNKDINALFNIVLNKTFLVLLFSWISLFTYYSFDVCFSNDNL